MTECDGYNCCFANELGEANKRIAALEKVAEAAERMHKHGSQHPADVRIENALRAAGYLKEQGE